MHSNMVMTSFCSFVGPDVVYHMGHNIESMLIGETGNEMRGIRRNHLHRDEGQGRRTCCK